MTDKIFVGRCVAGKYPEQVDIGFTKEHLDLLYSHLNEKGWVNARVNKGKDSGKPYMEIVVPELTTSRQTQPTYYNPPPLKEKAVSSFGVDNAPSDDLPF